MLVTLRVCKLAVSQVCDKDGKDMHSYARPLVELVSSGSMGKQLFSRFVESALAKQLGETIQTRVNT